jgi:hypothetical protein
MFPTPNGFLVAPELNPDEYLNGDLKQQVARRAPARTVRSWSTRPPVAYANSRGSPNSSRSSTSIHRCRTQRNIS